MCADAYIPGYMSSNNMVPPDWSRVPRSRVPPRTTVRTHLSDSGASLCDSNWALGRRPPDACRRSIRWGSGRSYREPRSTLTAWSRGSSSGSPCTSRAGYRPRSGSRGFPNPCSGYSFWSRLCYRRFRLRETHTACNEKWKHDDGDTLTLMELLSVLRGWNIQPRAWNSSRHAIGRQFAGSHGLSIHVCQETISLWQPGKVHPS